MKPNDSKVVEWLNAVLKNELTAINQYFLHSRMLRNWGLDRLADHEHAESIDEMKHAEMLIDRILLLEGLPNLQVLGGLRVGETAEEVIRCDLQLEVDALQVLRDAIEFCESVHDYVSRDLFSKILESEEEHVDWLETQLELINMLGVEKYLAEQIQGA
ncbi:MAG: bacterioferritin [Pseudomonadales bacterium]|nr:bacterioferritin [Pseudomonadales bacterium]